MKTHRDLKVWNEAMDLVTQVYSVSLRFPKGEIYGLTSQMRRAEISIPSNIAEGSARSHNREYKQYLTISLGSASELETQILISNRLGYLNHEECDVMISRLNEISRMLQGMIKRISLLNQ